MDIIFNELSLNHLPATPAQAQQVLNQWLEVVLQIRQQQRVTPAFRTTSSLHNLPVVSSNDYFFSQWLSALPREQRGLALSASTKEPFVRETYPEYRFCSPSPVGYYNAECVGFAYAIEHYCLTWSLDAFGDWIDIRYQLAKVTIEEEQLQEEVLSAWHLPTTGLTVEHQPFLNSLSTQAQQSIKQVCRAGSDMVANWTDWFPNLLLTSSAERGLQALPTAMAQPILERLLRLQRFFETWDGVPLDYSILGFHTNRESTSRAQALSVLTLTLPDGTTQLMDWHMRYPLSRNGGGRLFFIPDTDSRLCYIGYIGPKSGVT